MSFHKQIIKYKNQYQSKYSRKSEFKTASKQQRIEIRPRIAVVTVLCFILYFEFRNSSVKRSGFIAVFLLRLDYT